MNTIKENLMKYMFLFTACISIISVLLICVFLLGTGLPAISKIGALRFLFGNEWRPSNNVFGIFSMIISSIYATVGSMIVGVPIGFFSAIFLAYFCPKKIYKLLKPTVNLLAGIPSIVYGFFGLVVLVPIIQNIFGGSGKGLLTASILLGIMILPTIINVTESSLNAVPKSYYEGSLALGATHERSVFKVVFPAAKSGVMAGVVLGLGRAIGETMAVMMIAGNQPVIASKLTSGIRTLTANIALEMGYATGLHREALIATAVVLFVFILIINICFSIIKNNH